MKKLVSVLVMAMLALMSVPVLADTPVVGSGIGIDIPVEQFMPYIWMDPDTRLVYHNPADGGAELIQRINNYAFEGEQVCWDVLVMDKNGVEKISDVYVTVGATQGAGNDIEANCDIDPSWADLDDITDFNAWISEERLLVFDEDTMGVYNCCLTVEPYDLGAGMYGEYWVVAEVEDLDGLQNTFDENEYWYFNPQIVLTLSDTGLVFGDVSNPVRPGTYSYANTLSLTNDADLGSGVLLDMTISGTDFYDPVSSGAKCPLSNRLRLNDGNEGGGLLPLEYVSGQADNYRADVDGPGGLVDDDQVRCRGAEDAAWDWALEDGTGDRFCYYATQGAYSTNNDADRIDIEGYVGIPYETGNERDRAPIISSSAAADTIDWGAGAGSVDYFAGNILSPGADMSITFRLALPEPCNGDFSSGSVYFWGEAI